MLMHDIFPFILTVIYSGKYSPGGIGIQRFDDPSVLLIQNLIHPTETAVHQICIRNMLFHKFFLFFGEKIHRCLFPQHLEKPFIMRNLRTDGTDHAYILILHCLNKGLNLLIMCHNIAGYRSSINHVNRMPCR